MTAQEYLGQVRCMDEHIDALLERCQRNRERVSRMTTAYGEHPRGGGKKSDWADMIACIMEDEHRMNQEIDRLYKLKQEIYQVIGEVSDRKLRMILELRYLNYKTWEEIAEIADCDKVTVWRRHTRALQKVRLPGEKLVS